MRDVLREEAELISKIEKSERQIKEGKVTKADSGMSFKEIDDILIGD